MNKTDQIILYATFAMILHMWIGKMFEAINRILGL